MIRDFQEHLNFSRGVREKTDIETLRSMIPGAVRVEKTDTDTDKLGIDYRVRLRRGAVINVDAKARDAGCSRYWTDRRHGASKGEPDLALEIYSVVPNNGKRGKVGWTLNESSDVDLILFTFDPSDYEFAFLVGFQNLRIAFREFLPLWMKWYPPPPPQNSGGWMSQCIFVPETVVHQAMWDACTKKVWKELYDEDYEQADLFD